MKVEKATIKLVLRTNKVLSNGNHPIMIRVNWGGKRAEKSTGYSCKKSQWNDNTSFLKEGKGAIDNAKQINIVLAQKIKNAESIRNDFVLRGEPYSALEIINRLDEINPSSKPIYELQDFKKVYQVKKHLRLETIGSINTTVMNFTRFMNKKKIFLTEITKTDVESFGRWLTNEGKKTNTVITTLRNLSALFSYAVEIGAIKESPFTNFKIGTKYRQESHKQPISIESIELFKYYWMYYMTTLGGDKRIYKEAMTISSKLFAMNVFLMSYELQGLAMVDMAKLTTSEVKDFEYSHDGKGYLIITTHRSKTGKEVTIVLTPDLYNYPLFKFYIEYMRENNHLLPIFRKKDDTEKKQISRIRYATEWVNRKLHGHGSIDGRKAYVGIWNEFNQWLTDTVEKNVIIIKRKNIEVNKKNVKSFFIAEDTTFYAARHSLASNFINSEGATAGELASLLGRNVSGIDRYIAELGGIKKIIDARNKMK